MNRLPHLVLAFLACVNLSTGLDFQPAPLFMGQVTAWDQAVQQNTAAGIPGIRIIPRLEMNLGRLFYGEVDVAGSVRITLLPRDTNWLRSELRGKWHRNWLRYSSERCEIRVGLQRFDFGPGKVLRALQWFDELDPQDPAGYTGGVSGIRYTYFHPNQSALWLWGIQSRSKLRKFDNYPSIEKGIELGGRWEFTFLAGDMGLTFHQRTIDANGVTGTEGMNMDQDPAEYRLAVDGYWDPGPGIWFEAVQISIDNDEIPGGSQVIAMTGTDYTLRVGNGLVLSAEYMLRDIENQDAGNPIYITALNCSYPVSFLDIISYYWVHSSEWGDHIHSLIWQHTTDQIICQLTFILHSGKDGIAGTGWQRDFRWTLVYNF